MTTVTIPSRPPYRAPFWVTFFGGKKAVCIETMTPEEARALGATMGEVRDVKRLPYPADPRTDPTDCPAFCYRPADCAGRTACPQRVACTE